MFLAAGKDREYIKLKLAARRQQSGATTSTEPIHMITVDRDPTRAARMSQVAEYFI